MTTLDIEQFDVNRSARKALVIERFDIYPFCR